MRNYFGIHKSTYHFTNYRQHKITYICTKQYSSDVKITLGNITKVVKLPKNPQYVPQSYLQENCGQSTLHHLRWMMQKDILGQDIFLLGPPGPKKRNIAMQYLELTSREVEYVALSRDTTESDLKQRREIASGTAKYFDQSAVRAATQGSVLVLEGIEKAERNVLPVLNNLLENREMHLEDGRLLIPASRYDKLLQEHGKEELDKWKLVRVSEDFRVIALGLPVPKYIGNPLDPPLRSRFQARNVDVDTYQEYLSLLKDIAPTLPFQKIESLVSAAFALNSKESLAMGLPDFPVENLKFAVKILENNPGVTVHDVISYLYPYYLLPKSSIKSVEILLEQFKIMSKNKQTISLSNLSQSFKNLLKNKETKTFIETPYQQQILEKMLQSTKVTDLCVIGPKGCGKSILTSQLSNLVNKDTEDIVLYHDMTSRDLIQQRTTLENGDTVWRFSPLITAALEGKIAVLDGIHRIHSSTLSVLHRLVHDRELQLYDGKRLISSEKYDKIKENYGLSDEQLHESGILKIHSGFQIIALGEPPTTQGVTNWLTPEVISLFLFQEVRPLLKQEETEIISKAFGPICNSMKQLIELGCKLKKYRRDTAKL
ncbi:von Willebrand factor A domain-containing protein 8 [Agrilus planipennis]|uniref:von Willebrand factor A domain-containing protein 8 n=1 Tax=Agrilus planipennis TaxID=224129 RepID=A0A7F5RC80_AGRPL|nr:von Willebrand factor A domain-containing protein 8 [Agrilus planipennis]